MHYFYQLFIILLEEKVSINFFIVLIGLLVVLSRLFQNAEATIKVVLLDNSDKFFHNVIIVAHIADKLIIDSLLVFILAQTFYVKLHYLFS